MAEFVEHNMEEMLPELEQTLRVGLLEENQIRALVRRRRRLEYKIARRTKRPRDYQSYIRHEIRLLALLKQKRHSLGYQFKRDEIERSIVLRVQRLHRQLCYRFQSEPAHWLAAARFLESVGFLDAASKTLQRMLQVHPDKAELWALTSRWIWQIAPELKCARIRNDKNKRSALAREAPIAAAQSRDLLLRGLRRLPDATILYRELVSTEAGLGGRLVDAMSDSEGDWTSAVPSSAADLDVSAIKDGKTVRAVVYAALEKFFGDRKLVQSLYDVCSQFDYLCEVAKELETRLQEMPVSMETQETQEVGKTEPTISVSDEVESIFKKNGLDAVREWWKDAVSTRVLHAAAAAKTYLHLETSAATTVDMTRVRAAAEVSLNGLGLATSSVDLWLEYIRAEENHGDPLRVADLDWRARKFLSDKCLTEYSLRRLYPHMENKAN